LLLSLLLVEIVFMEWLLLAVAEVQETLNLLVVAVVLELAVLLTDKMLTLVLLKRLVAKTDTPQVAVLQVEFLVEAVKESLQLQVIKLAVLVVVVLSLVAVVP
jgi:hypothetical protein